MGPEVTNCFYVLKTGGEPTSRELKPECGEPSNKLGKADSQGRIDSINHIHGKVFSHASIQGKR